MRNPLILAVVAALPVALLAPPLPGWLLTSGDYFASLTLPLALICIGATLSFGALQASGAVALSASLMKMVVIPILATAAAWLAGFEGRELGVMFLFFASPTAAAAFVMARAMGGNADAHRQHHRPDHPDGQRHHHPGRLRPADGGVDLAAPSWG